MENVKDYVISAESFEFAQLDSNIHDQKLDTKPIGFLKDAFKRFCKNKGSVVAASVILVLVLFAIFAPIFSRYELSDRDNIYVNKAPYLKGFDKAGFWDGGHKYVGLNNSKYQFYRGIAQETGLNPILSVSNVKVVTDPYSGKTVSRDVRVQTYYAVGVVTLTLSQEEFDALCDYQNKNDIQVLYPYVDYKDLCDTTNDFSLMLIQKLQQRVEGANYWYKIDTTGAPVLDANKNFVPAYTMYPTSKRKQTQYPTYTSKRINGDPYTADGTNLGYAYGKHIDGGISVRVCYWNYYTYKHGFEPHYIFGTEQYGKDLLTCLSSGARFSLLLAFCVSLVNLTIGTIYGAIEGYYGGIADIIMERISDILSCVPMMIVVTLFNLHLAKKVGAIPSFILAFVSTGWIGMASLVRKQFYRFKGQEYILAARTLGANDLSLMFKHIFPNSLGTIVTSCVLVIPGVIGSETMLTYLGIVNLESDTVASVGTLMQQGYASLFTSPHVLVFPAVFLALLLICFNLFGNGLRDAFNPSLRGAEG